MADFDFDELDQAVVSALGKKPPVEVSESVSADSQDATQPAPRRATRPNTGRAFDMVIRKQPTRRPKAKPVAVPVRQVAPSADEVDEIDALEPQVAEEVIMVEDETVEVAVDDTQESAEESPYSKSPFIPDAKVEKRPLGAFTKTQSDSGGDEDQLGSTETYQEPAVTKTRQQSGATDSNQSVFDIATYHTQPTKKTSSRWLSLLSVVFVIAIGIGIGAGFYYLVLPYL